jgi:hypothetical protein
VLDWNTPAIEFYQSLGAKLMREWLTMRVSGEELVGLALQEETEVLTTQGKTFTAQQGPRN